MAQAIEHHAIPALHASARSGAALRHFRHIRAALGARCLPNI